MSERQDEVSDPLRCLWLSVAAFSTRGRISGLGVSEGGRNQTMCPAELPPRLALATEFAPKLERPSTPRKKQNSL